MQLELIHNAKLPKSFNSCRWRRGYNPDLCFVSRRLAHLSEKAVLNPLPKSQHQPISVTIKPAITKSEVPFRRRFNLKKAKWAEYNEGMEKALLDVEPTPDNYTMFVQAVKKTARADIPRGCRKDYIAGLTEESLQLMECYETEFGNDPFSDTTSKLGDALMESLGKERRKAGQDLIENINMTQNSKKAWSTIRKLNADAKLCNVIRCLLSNRMFYVTFNNRKSRWFHQTNGLPQGSVLAPLLFNVYTNDQPLPEGCSRFIYADDLAMATQQHNFPEIESTLERGLLDMSAYYLENHLRPNPGKTQICSFHLKNREAKWELDVTWDGIKLKNHQHPVYLGVTLDRTLSYKAHTQKTRAKVSTRNSLLRQLTNKVGGSPKYTAYIGTSLVLLHR
ncbi:hypothetical protein AAFF_G00253560 [Aldrovandia affinis]|uniref:Reverse transcriptase domain-containing protein n=1 Tax=Aldrovandia affinis TaxID=143900 RepID=A0AAD7SU14_9TELE|nr:hypothetical protein AAFF_G00253560 [Aldrovandia affinis]